MKRTLLAFVSAALLATMLASAASTALPDKVLDFDDVAPGKLTTQLRDRGGSGQGAEFGSPLDYGFYFTDGSIGQGLVKRSACGAPFVERSGGARSGDRVARLGCGTEYQRYGTFGVLPRWRTKLTAHVRVITPGLDPGTFTLTAYDYRRNPIDTQTTTATGGEAWKPLTITVGKPSIAYFALYWNRVEAGGLELALDDLTFDQPETPPAPQISISRSDGSRGIVVHQGQTVTADFEITRWNGSAGSVSLSTGFLNPEIDAASFGPNPVAGTQSKLFLHARVSDNPSFGGVTSIETVVATPLSPSAGSTTDANTFPLDVLPVFDFWQRGATVDLPPCVPTTVLAGLSVAPGFSQPISLDASVRRESGAPTGITARIEPATYTAGFSKPPEVTIVAPGTEPLQDAVLSLTASSPGYPTRRAAVKLRRVGPSIEAVVADLPGRTIPVTATLTQQFVRPAERIVIRGRGFCSSKPLVQFGNPSAIEPAESVSADGARLTVSVPRDATTGPIFVRTLLGSAESAPVQVASYRNRDGFNFANYASQRPYTFDELTSAYGQGQTYWVVDSCWYVPFKTCRALRPNPFALAVAGAIRDFGKNGLCFGFSLGSIRLREGWVSLEYFRPVPKSPPPKTLEETTEEDRRKPKFVWEVLQYWSTDDLIRRMHLYQLSREVDDLRDHGYESPVRFRDRLRRELRNEDPVLISFQYGNKGHAIVAYDVVDYARGRFDIMTYDPNRPYGTGEEGDTIAAAKAHADAEEGSIMRVLPDGTWSYPGLGWSGDMEDLTMMPLSSIPETPRLSYKIPNIAVAMATGAGRVAQVTNAAGETLLRPSGRNNLAAFPGAVVLAPLDSREGANPKVLLPSRAKVDVTVGGRGAGAFSAAVLNSRLTALVQGTTRPGATDRITLDGRAGSLTFAAGAGAKPIVATLVSRTGATSARTVTLRTTSFAGGADSLSITRGGSVSVRHTGAATRVVLELGGVEKSGAPAAFVTPRIRIGAGETLALSPRWESLGERTLSVTLTPAGGAARTITVRDAARAAVRIEKPRLGAKVAAGKATLSIAARVAGPVGRDAQTTVTFVVLRGTRAVASTTMPATPESLRRGVVWRTKRLPGGRYTLVGGVTAFAPAGGGVVLEDASRSARIAFAVR